MRTLELGGGGGGVLFENVRGRNRSENFNTSDERTEEGVVEKISDERTGFFVLYFSNREGEEQKSFFLFFFFFFLFFFFFKMSVTMTWEDGVGVGALKTSGERTGEWSFKA